MGIEVPSCTEDASAAFVTRAFHEGGVLAADSRVAEVAHEPIGVGVGIVGQLARLSLRYEGEALHAPGTVVLKLPSQFPENRAVADHFNFYEREGRFYEQVSDKLAVRTPVCFWNHIDVGTATFALLLEDLGQRTMISQVTGVSPARASSALECLAELHGSWWASPGLDALDWMPRLDDPINLAAGQQYRDAWPVFLERIGRAIPVEALELGERIGVAMEDLLQRLASDAPPTMCHGDFRIDNLLFDDAASGPDRVAICDWQISYRGPAITDVAYFLCQSMEVEDRRAHEDELVRAWHAACTAAHGSDLGYPVDLAWEHYRRSTLSMTVYPVTSLGAMDPANERGLELVTQMAIRSFTAALDLKAADLL